MVDFWFIVHQKRKKYVWFFSIQLHSPILGATAWNNASISNLMQWPKSVLTVNAGPNVSLQEL